MFRIITYKVSLPLQMALKLYIVMAVESMKIRSVVPWHIKIFKLLLFKTGVLIDKPIYIGLQEILLPLTEC